MLLEAVWDYYFDPQTNVIDVKSAACVGKSTKTTRRNCSAGRGTGYMISADD
jgi:hypothetical protein